MFDGLKKRLSSVIKAFSSKEEKELEERGEEADVAPQSAEPAAEMREPEPAGEAPAQHGKDEGAKNGPPRTEPPRIQAPEPPNPHATARPEAREPLQSNKSERGREQRPPQQVQRRPNRTEGGIHISAATKVKGAIFGKVRLSESDIEGFLDTLRMSMLESDVAYGDTEDFLSRLEGSLREERIGAKDIRSELMRNVRESLLAVISKTHGVNLEAFVARRIEAAEIPIKILFIGPNGTGKTTTIAKVAHLLKQRGATIAISASDTFRAAAIEQTEYHAAALRVPVIKSKYGADPASVAFDAVAYAKAHGLQVVLIDSAGRQETNKNLIGELQKMERVIKPDLNIYVCESTGGNAIISQVKEFTKHIRVDGIILTKLDCDAKGGGAISIANETGIPILFLGTGEKYADLVPYDPQVILDAMLPGS